MDEGADVGAGGTVNKESFKFQVGRFSFEFFDPGIGGRGLVGDLELVDGDLALG